MKIRGVIVLTVATTLAGASYCLMQVSHDPPVTEPAAIATDALEKKVQKENSVAPGKMPPAPASRPKPQSVRSVAIPPVEAADPAAKGPPTPRTPNHPDPGQYWKQQARRFNHLMAQLAREQDPAKRKSLMQAIAAYVRIDTLGTLDWAMGLEDPDEKRLALENINKMALSGIGARIQKDETGFPRILETTVLSAAAATGQVEPGDYIVGIVDTDGVPVSFKDLSVQQVVKHLRGQPGSDLQLLMERVPTDGNGESYSFDVSVQRSLLVIQPPY